MGDEIIRTGVDELLALLNYTSKIPLTEAAKKLNVHIDVVQAWVDFLVEERIVGIEYKFTTPYIYLNKSIETNIHSESTKVPDNADMTYFKKAFWDKAKNNNIPKDQIEMLWTNHLLQELELKKKYFFFEAQQRKLTNIDDLWKEYQNNLLIV
jgi:hypothetical protein